jgi:1-acyl-sn-glycerol-3-phosphate acyltransferase
VVIANHQSLFDIPVKYGWSGLDLKFVMKKELKRIPLFGQACAAKGHVFVDRSDRQRAIDSLNSSVNDLHKGESVIIYPEGTRSRNGRVQKFRKGAFRLALATGMPILPISVAGTDRIQPPDSLRLYPGKAAIRIHEPIEVEGLDEQDLDELMNRSRERIIQGKIELEESLGLSSKERTFEEEDLSSQ